MQSVCRKPVVKLKVQRGIASAENSLVRRARTNRFFKIGIIKWEIVGRLHEPVGWWMVREVADGHKKSKLVKMLEADILDAIAKYEEKLIAVQKSITRKLGYRQRQVA